MLEWVKLLIFRPDRSTVHCHQKDVSARQHWTQVLFLQCAMPALPSLWPCMLIIPHLFFWGFPHWRCNLIYIGWVTLPLPWSIYGSSIILLTPLLHCLYSYSHPSLFYNSQIVFQIPLILLLVVSMLLLRLLIPSSKFVLIQYCWLATWPELSDLYIHTIHNVFHPSQFSIHSRLSHHNVVTIFL